MNRPGCITLLAFVALASTSACAPRPRMCTTSTECVASSACVAGRCQADRPNVKPAVESARRIVVRPVEIAYLRRGEGPSDGALPPLFALGKDGAIALFRFSVAIPQGSNIIEAYLVLRRSDAVDDDPAPVHLHATRIVQAWDSRSTSWALAPQIQETRGAPTTVVEPGGSSLVRLDVRDLVRNWTRHDPRDHGLAVVAENDTRTGTTFAMRSLSGPDRGLEATPGLASGRPGDVRSTSLPDVEPYLELYVR